MSARGEAVGPGYIKGKGPVQVFQDLDKTTMFHALTRRGEWLLVKRDRVIFTKTGHRK